MTGSALDQGGALLRLRRRRRRTSALQRTAAGGGSASVLAAYGFPTSGSFRKQNVSGSEQEYYGTENGDECDGHGTKAKMPSFGTAPEGASRSLPRFAAGAHDPEIHPNSAGTKRGMAAADRAPKGLPRVPSRPANRRSGANRPHSLLGDFRESCTGSCGLGSAGDGERRD